MQSISLEAVIAITERSKRTWWRRIAEQKVHRLAKDAGGRTILLFDDIVRDLCIRLDDEAKALLFLADAGHAEAQNEVGQLFLAAEKPEAAVYWLSAAAEQGYADAMQLLGGCYAAGQGVPKDLNLSLMWIAKAAAGGHVIALSQIAGLFPFRSVAQ
uniref:tetratricopeptide repeat protein n=1 Tax=Pseudomonas sp. TaxID=306 RepID=UPI0010B1F9F2|nr:SEL1-like repeat protein [Pseudomonas sp.]QBM91755.1 sel1 repeat protein [Pseudomonas sp.]